MDTLELPTFTLDRSIDEILKETDGAEVGALVGLDIVPHLIPVTDLVVAQACGATVLAEVPRTRAIWMVDTRLAKEMQVSLEDPHQSADRWEDLLDRRGYYFAGVLRGSGSCGVITRSEGAAHRFGGGAGRCTCRNCKESIEPPKRVDGRCPICQSDDIVCR